MNFVPAIVFWILTLYLFRPSTFAQRPWKQREGLYMRLFAFHLAVGLTFQLDPIGHLLDRVTGIPNLSWFAGYAPCVVGAFFAAFTWLQAAKLPTQRSLIISIAALSGMILLLPPLTGEPEAAHGIPTTHFQLAYCVGMYLFLSAMALEVLIPMRVFLKAEKLPTGRLRLALSVLAVYWGLIFIFLRVLTVFMISFNLNRPLANQMDFTAIVLLAFCAATFGLALVPLRFLAVAVRAWNFVQQQQALYQLENLRGKLMRLTGPLPWPLANWRERFTQPSYALYCVVIDILDRRSLLLAHPQVHGTAPTIPKKIDWLLSPLPQTDDWVELLQYFRQKLNGQ